MDDVAALACAAHEFGPRAARRKQALLERLIGGIPRSRRALEQLRGTLLFMRAYPDDPTVLTRVNTLISSLPAPPPVHYTFSFENVEHLDRVHPGRLEIDWPAIEDESDMVEMLMPLVRPNEVAGLEDHRLSLRDWFAMARPASENTDLGFLLALLRRSPMPASASGRAYDRCEIPTRFDPPEPTALGWPTGRTVFTRRPMARERMNTASEIRGPLARVERGGSKEVDLARVALLARKLEIFPLIHASPHGIRVAHCGRGLTITVIGVDPASRSPLESLYYFLLRRNGTPIGYGPAGLLFGCCEMGINLFPEFRGGEIRWLCAQIMRVLHHVLGAEYFYLVRYAMGEDNKAAIDSGAFWFYRKMGFRALNPRVEALAREEEKKMARRPSYRSDRRMLQRLSHTEACFDLSDGRRSAFDFASLGHALTRFIADRFDGNGQLAERTCTARIARIVEARKTDASFRALAPVVAMIPGLERWSRSEKAALRGVLESKGAPSEIGFTRRLAAHGKLEHALRALSGGPPGQAPPGRARDYPSPAA